jgi:hypothetical protein
MLMGYDAGISTSDEADSWDAQTRQVHWPIGAVLNSEYAPALRALGLLDPVSSKLGTGGFGCAYHVTLFGRDAVLKLTRDPLEVVASWALRGKTTEHVVPIHEVWSLPKMQKYPHWASWWVIHRDYLHDFSKRDGDLLQTVFDVWKDEDLGLSIPRAGVSGRATREKWRACMREHTHCTPIEVSRALVLLDQISKGIREMGQIGIDWTDILPDNLLRDRSGALRIADVGFGQPKRDIECEPPELTLDLARQYRGA